MSSGQRERLVAAADTPAVPIGRYRAVARQFTLPLQSHASQIAGELDAIAAQLPPTRTHLINVIRSSETHDDATAIRKAQLGP